MTAHVIRPGFVDKAWASAVAEAAVCGATVTKTWDDDGSDVFVLNWKAWTRADRSLDTIRRLIATLPRAIAR